MLGANNPFLDVLHMNTLFCQSTGIFASYIETLFGIFENSVFALIRIYFLLEP